MIKLGIFPECPVAFTLSPDPVTLLSHSSLLLRTLIKSIGLGPRIMRSLQIEQVPNGLLLNHTTLPYEGALLSVTAHSNPDDFIATISGNSETVSPRHALVDVTALKRLEPGGGSTWQRLSEFLAGRTTQTSFINQLGTFLSSGLLTSAIIMSQSSSTDPLLGKFGAIKRELDTTAPESQGTGPRLTLFSYQSGDPLRDNPTLRLANLLCGQIDPQFLQGL